MRGRPPKQPDEMHSESMKIPLTAADKSAIQEAAASLGEKPVTWARDHLVRLAQNALKNAKPKKAAK